MNEATVTSRMSSLTKERAQKVFSKRGTNASKVINTLFERVIAEGDVSFLLESERQKETLEKQNLKRAIEFVDSIPRSNESRFDNMSKREIKKQRLVDRGLL